MVAEFHFLSGKTLMNNLKVFFQFFVTLFLLSCLKFGVFRVSFEVRYKLNEFIHHLNMKLKEHSFNDIFDFYHYTLSGHLQNEDGRNFMQWTDSYGHYFSNTS